MSFFQLRSRYIKNVLATPPAVPPTTGTIKVNVSGTFVDKPIYVKVSGSFVAKPIQKM